MEGIREIKFRAKDAGTDQWVYGSLIQYPEGGNKLPYTVIQSHEERWDSWSVMTKTIGQFTGLQDKEGNDIYEGDVLGGYPHGTAFVSWSDKWACFQTTGIYGEYDINEQPSHDLLSNDLDDCGDAWEVIGNIHDNPELIEKPIKH